MSTRKPYPSDVSDDEWAIVAPYLTLMTQRAPQRDHPMREVFNALRLLARAGSAWRYLPNNLPPWHTVYEQTQRWMAAGCFEAVVHDLREMLRLTAGRKASPSAVILDGRTLQSGIRYEAMPLFGHGAGPGQATTATRRGAAARSTWRQTRWATYRPF